MRTLPQRFHSLDRKTPQFGVHSPSLNMNQQVNQSGMVHDHAPTSFGKKSVLSGSVLRIDHPADGQFRSRKVVTRSRARATGKYASWKVGRMVQWESRHELNAFRLLDCDPSVRRFSEQPCTIGFQIDGVPRVHHPDILVELGTQKELWEVKTAEDASSPEIVERTTVLTRELPAWGYTYRLILAHDLAMQPRLTNALILLQYGRRPTTMIEREMIRQLLQHADGLQWGDICAGLFGPQARAIVSRMVLEGALCVDMHTPISRSTTIAAKKGVL